MKMPKKALSIKQPWAWLIVHGYKDIENRDWKQEAMRRFRGWFAVHASKTFDQDGYDMVKEEFPEIPLPEPHEFEMGGIVGAAHVIDCVTTHESDWFMGRYGLVIDKAGPCDFIPMKGQLGWFNTVVSVVTAPIYVDELHEYPEAKHACFRSGACHMSSDDLEALHAFAAKLGLRREWFQNHGWLPHYDLTRSKRELALKNGAIEISARERYRQIKAREKEAS